MTERRPEDELFEYVVYLVSSARLSLEEPPIYGSFRLAEGASRLIEAAPRLGLNVDETLARARASIEREKLRMIDDHAGYAEWLGELLRELAEEATGRNLALPE